MQVVQRVAVLGEDDDLALTAGGVVHLRVVLEDLREFVPLAVLAGGDDGLGLLFEALQDDDFGFQLGDGLGSGRLVDEGLFEVLLLLGVEVVVVLGDGGQGLGRALAGRGRRAFLRAGGVSSRSLRRLSDWKMASGLEARRRCRAVRAKPTEPLREPSSWSALPISVLNVVGDGFVERGLDVGERVVDGVGLALRERAACRRT